jgi:hypothetical protein
MKHLTIILLFAVTALKANAQVKYNHIGQLGEFKSDWALVELGNKLGFIDEKGKEIIKPIYNMIGQFGEFKSDWALVKLDDKVGFINDKGEEVIKPTTKP